MNTENTIHFIKSSRGLHLDNKMFVKVFLVLPLMISFVLFNGWQYSDMFRTISVLLSLVVVVLDICYLLLLSKKMLKYKLFFRPIIVLNIVVPLFYICCLIFYGTFGLKNFLMFYLLPSLVLSLAVVLVGFFVISGKTEGKIKVTSSVLGCLIGGTTVLISRRINNVMSDTLSENMHFSVIAVLMLLLNSITFSVIFFDLMRFYYYTKLEKMGIVTEDILKAEK